VGVAVNVTVVPAHTVVALALTATDGVRLELTVIAMLLLLAVAEVTHVADEVRVQVTVLPLASVVLVKVALFVPAFIPFTFHWYAGVAPPLVGVAVKVTEAPAQIVVAEAEMVTDGVISAFTVIVILLLVAVEGEAHAALDVNTQLTMSPLDNVVAVNVALFVPALAPLTRH
jgi:hypothetical protein